MKQLLKLTMFLAVYCVVICLSYVSASAACSHPVLTGQYSDASHPHAYYRYCDTCGIKLYTGGYAVKAHGNGAWGSGTCPSCGSHHYTGQSCEGVGACSCGATIPSLGHSYGPIYSEAVHPHRYFKQCTRCSYIVYTGGNETKTHGNGAWGSGTCPSCGEHRYLLDTEAVRSHPHPIREICVCGSNIIHGYGYGDSCEICVSTLKSSTNSDTKTFLFLVGEEIGFAPFSAKIDYNIRVKYTTISNGAVFRDISVFALCKSWTGAGISDLRISVGYTANIENSSGSNVGSVDLSMHPYWSDPAWIAHDSKSGTNTIVYSGRPLTVTGSGGALVSDALYPTGVFQISTVTQS